MLAYVRRLGIFDIWPTHEGHFMLAEPFDGDRSVFLTAQQVLKLANEMRALVDASAIPAP